MKVRKMDKDKKIVKQVSSTAKTKAADLTIGPKDGQ